MIIAAPFSRAMQVMPLLLTWLFLAALLAAIASTYVGHASSPYNGCVTPDGRSVSCELLETMRP